MKHFKQFFSIILSLSLIIASMPAELLGRSSLAPPGNRELQQVINLEQNTDRTKDIPTIGSNLVSRRSLLEREPELEEKIFILDTFLPLLPVRERRSISKLVDMWDDSSQDRISDEIIKRVDDFFIKGTNDLKDVEWLLPVKKLKKTMDKGQPEGRRLGIWIEQIYKAREKLPHPIIKKIFGIRQRWQNNTGNISTDNIVAIRKHTHVRREAMQLLTAGRRKKWPKASRQAKIYLIRDLIRRVPGKDRLSQLIRDEFWYISVLGTNKTLLAMNKYYKQKIANIINDLGDITVEKSRKEIEQEAPKLLSSGNIRWGKISIPMQKYLIECLIRGVPGKDRLSQLVDGDFRNVKILKTNKILWRLFHWYQRPSVKESTIQKMINKLGDVHVKKTQEEIKEEAPKLLSSGNITWDKISIPMKKNLIECLIRAVPGKDRLSQLTQDNFEYVKILGTEKTLFRLYQLYPKPRIKNIVNDLGDITVEKSRKEIEQEALMLLEQEIVNWGKISIPMQKYLVECLIRAVPGKYCLSQLEDYHFRNVKILGTKKILNVLFRHYNCNVRNMIFRLGDIKIKNSNLNLNTKRTRDADTSH